MAESELMSGKHRFLLDFHCEKLKESVNISSSLLVDVLRELNVLTQHEDELIRCPAKRLRGQDYRDDDRTDDSRSVDQLLKLLAKKNDQAFLYFCEALRRTNQQYIVDSYLSETALAEVVSNFQQDVAQYYCDTYKSQMFSWAKENQQVNLADIYVSLQWVEHQRTPQCVKEEPMEEYYHVLRKRSDGELLKVLIRGEPSSGKTTFVKKISYDWASIKITISDTAQEIEIQQVLGDYDLLIVVVLRFVKPGATLLESILDQMNYKMKQHKRVLTFLLSKNRDQRRTMFVLDGLDEYDPETSDEITRLMKGEIYREACILVTTRPEAACRIRDWEEVSYKEAEITGFDHNHIVEYIGKFFKTQKEKGDGLCDTIFNQNNQSSELSDLAKIPGILCLLCILYEEGRPIGTERGEIYEEIVAYILSWWEQRPAGVQTSRSDIVVYFFRWWERRSAGVHTSRSNILHKYKSLLNKFGNLANTRGQNQEMQLTFLEENVKKCVCEKAMDFGFLYKPHLLERLKDSHVSFMHKTVQEFLAAYFIRNTESYSENTWLALLPFYSLCQRGKASRMFHLLKGEISLTRFLVHHLLTPIETYDFVKYLTKYIPPKDVIEHFLQVFAGYRKVAKEFSKEDIIIKHEQKTYLYRYPFCVLFLSDSDNDNDRMKEYRELVEYNPNPALVKINKPRKTKVSSLTLVGDGTLNEFDIGLAISCCCPVEAIVDGENLDKLILRYIKYLRKLQLQNINDHLHVELERVNMRGYMTIVDPWVSKITKLSMIYCSLDVTDLKHLVTGLCTFPGEPSSQRRPSSVSRLQELDLRGNKLTGGGSDIGRLVSVMTSCVRLSLNHCVLNDDDFHQIVEAFIQKSSAAKEESDHQEVEPRFPNGSSSRPIHSASIQQPPVPLSGIEKLDLSHNELTDVKVLVQLFDNLPPSFRELYLYFNKFGDRMVDIVEHTQRMRGLRTLWVKNDTVSEDAIQEICFGLERNLPGITLDITKKT